MDSTKATYSAFTFEVDGKPALAVINSDLKEWPQRSDYTHAVFITIVPAACNEDGHPTGEEQDYLLAVEEKLMRFLETRTETVYIGQTTLPGKREIIFYTKTPVIIESFLELNLPKVNRENSFEIIPDEAWEQVSGFYEQL